MNDVTNYMMKNKRLTNVNSEGGQNEYKRFTE